MSSDKVLSNSYECFASTLDSTRKTYYHKPMSFSQQRRSSSTEKSSEITKTQKQSKRFLKDTEMRVLEEREENLPER